MKSETMREADLLAKVSLFSLMKREDLERIASLAHRHSYHDGDVIIQEGEHDRRLFIIVRGQVEVIKRLGNKKKRRVRTLGFLNYFGEMALIDDLVRSASVVAKEDTELLALDQWDLSQEIEKYPQMAFELLRTLRQRIRAIEKGMANTIGALLPLCAHCKKIHEQNGSWITIEKYIKGHSEADFSHGLCPQCISDLYPEYVKKTSENED